MTMSALSDELAQVRTKKKEFLAQIERIVPWKEWLTLIQPCYANEGCSVRGTKDEIMAEIFTEWAPAQEDLEDDFEL